MPRPTLLTPAQQNRDAGLSSLRRFTWWAAAGATALTVVASLIAANTVPGRASNPAPAASAPSGSGAGGGSSDGTGANPGAVNPPAQAPHPDLGNGPVAVSGGS